MVYWGLIVKISIIVPTYNAKDFIDNCVESLVNQTYENIEIILVNDGSTDNSGDSLDQWMEKDKRVKVFHKENGGTHSARNLGVEKSTGEYVMFIDPDDWFSLNAVECLVEEIKKTNADVIKFNYVKEYGTHFESKTNNLLKNKLYTGTEYQNVLRMNLGLVGEELKNIQDFNFLASVCFGCYKKEIIIQNELKFTNMKEIGTFSDGLFNLSFLLKASSFYFLDQHLYHYRKNNYASCTNTYRIGFYEKNKVLINKIRMLFDFEKLSNNFSVAYSNRVSYSLFELIVNEGLNNDFNVLKTHIKQIISDDQYVSELKKLNLKFLPLKWKICFSMMKTRRVFILCLLSKIMIFIKKRG